MEEACRPNQERGFTEAKTRQEGGDEQVLDNREAARESLPEDTPLSDRHPNLDTPPILPSSTTRQLETPPSSIIISNPQPS